MRRRNLKDAFWSFRTANLTVAFYAEPEEMDPADSFQFEDDIEAVRSGAVDWFCAVVEITGPEGELIAWDTLGGCAYNSVSEFVTSHRDPNPMNRNCSPMRAERGPIVICHYFPDMIAQACAMARTELARLRSIPLRAA